MAIKNHQYEWLMPCEALTRFQPAYDHKIYQQDTQPHQNTRYGYRIGKERFIVSEGVISEVVENSTIFPLPLTDPLLSGLVNLRGNLIPVYELAESNQWRVPYPHKHRILILKNHEGAVGIKIDDIPKPIYGKLSEKEQKVKQDFPWKDHISGVWSAEGNYWYEMNCHAFLKHRAEHSYATTNPVNSEV